MDIIKRINEYREQQERLQWEGTFEEYLELVKKNPNIAQTAHSRVYNMIKTMELKRGKMVPKNISFSVERCLAWKRPSPDWWKSIFTPLPSVLMYVNVYFF